LTKDLLKEMLNRVAYAASAAEYGLAMDELRKFKCKLVGWSGMNLNDGHSQVQEG